MARHATRVNKPCMSSQKISLHTGKDVTVLSGGEVLVLRAFCLCAEVKTHPGIGQARVLLREVAGMGEYTTMVETVGIGNDPPASSSIDID